LTTSESDEVGRHEWSSLEFGDLPVVRSRGLGLGLAFSLANGLDLVEVGAEFVVVGKDLFDGNVARCLPWLGRDVGHVGEYGLVVSADQRDSEGRLDEGLVPTSAISSSSGDQLLTHGKAFLAAVASNWVKAYL
jgi:hypothetical protein